MSRIYLSNDKGRDTEVYARSVSLKRRTRLLDEDGRPVTSARVITGTAAQDLAVLEQKAGGREDIGEMLLAADPEIDMETFGRALSDTSRVWVDQDGQVAYRVTLTDVVTNPDGSMRERRPHVMLSQNTLTDTPLRWSGRLMKRNEVYNRFVFANKMQLLHENGLTYDFLYAMAKQLEEADALLLVGAGPRANQPLVFRRGGSGYRGFLEGRTDGDRYCLLLHLSRMEMKRPKPEGEAAQ